MGGAPSGIAGRRIPCQPGKALRQGSAFHRGEERNVFILLFLMQFSVFSRTLLSHTELKSSDSSRKKAASSRKRPFTRCFYFIFFNKSEKQSHSAQHFCPAMTSKTPSQRFFAHAGLSKTKKCIFHNKSKVLLVYIQFLPWKKPSAQHFVQHPSALQKGMVWQSRQGLSKAKEYFVFRPRRRRRKP